MKKGQGRRRRRRISLEDRGYIRRLTLMCNAFMNLCLANNTPCVEEMLRVILGRDDLVVIASQTQKMYQGFRRSIIIDVYAEDSEGTRYNIEIQQSNEGAGPRRLRFHSALIDAYSLEKGQEFEELPECYVIFITLNDVLGLGKTMYTIHKYIDGELEPFDDGLHYIYINASAEDDGTELWKLIHDLRCADPDEMYFPRLAARVKFLKEDEEGIPMIYDDVLEEVRQKAEAKAEKRGMKIGRAEGRVEGRAEGILEGRAEGEARGEKKAQESIALKFLELGKLTLEEIANCSGLSLAKVRSLKKRLA